MRVKEFFKKLGDFFIKYKWRIIFSFLAILILSFFVYIVWDIWFANSGDSNVNLTKVTKEEKPAPRLFAAPYSGLDVEESRLDYRPLAVVIENHPSARPQSGLLEADLVFETLAEGGITRFLAIYQSRDSQEIGPVRSARNYFVEWADSLSALFAHVGGSQEALSLITKLGVSDLNQFYFGKYYWRDSSRLAPHNVYTTTQKLYEAAKSKGFSVKSENLGYSFKEDLEKTSRPPSQKFTVYFNYSYAPTYDYDPECNCYWRSILNQKHLDKSGKQISAKNVVVVFTDIGYYKARSSTYADIRTSGSGKAFVFLDGKKTTGTWQMKKGDIIRFFDANGKQIKLNKGSTWIDVVPIGTAIK